MKKWNPQPLNLKAGEWVEVRSREEILVTLDERGRLDNVPFMPEMLQYCGQKIRVSKRADKTCDNIEPWNMRRVRDTVHLEASRCDGACHGGCEAGCLIFWKESWLKRADSGLTQIRLFQDASNAAAGGLCTIDAVNAATRANGSQDSDGPVYSCQATEVRKFSTDLPGWDLRQYVRDVKSGNLASGVAGKPKSDQFMDTLLATARVFESLILGIFNFLQKRRKGIEYPHIQGRPQKTPLEKLGLQPGEMVQVLDKEEIVATLDVHNRNRGLLFDSEMLRYCGGIYRVLRRVHRIIDEKTGRMLEMKNACIILEGVACRADFHRFCPRAIYHYWRENWLRRVPVQAPQCDIAERTEQVCR